MYVIGFLCWEPIKFYPVNLCIVDFIPVSRRNIEDAVDRFRRKCDASPVISPPPGTQELTIEPKPYEGCLLIIRDEIIFFDGVKKGDVQQQPQVVVFNIIFLNNVPLHVIPGIKGEGSKFRDTNPEPAVRDSVALDRGKTRVDHNPILGVLHGVERDDVSLSIFSKSRSLPRVDVRQADAQGCIGDGIRTNSVKGIVNDDRSLVGIRDGVVQDSVKDAIAVHGYSAWAVVEATLGDHVSPAVVCKAYPYRTI